MGFVNRKVGNVLRLVHPGGIVEKHRRPVTAAEVMKKYPRHCVARPDVFKYPWIVVRPESVLQLGDVFYVVPFHTLRRLLQSKGGSDLLAYPDQGSGYHLPKEEAGAGLSNRREKIDCPTGLFLREELCSCHSVADRKGRSPNRRQNIESCSSNKMTSDNNAFEQWSSRRLSEDAKFHPSTKERDDGIGLHNRRHLNWERCSFSATANDHHESPAEVRTEWFLVGLPPNQERCSPSETDTEDLRLGYPTRMTSNKQYPEFTFQPRNGDGKYMGESSPDTAIIHCIGKHKSLDTSKKSLNWQMNDISIVNESRYPVNKCHDQLKTCNQYSIDQLRFEGCTDGSKKRYLVDKKYELNRGNNYRTDTINSESITMKRKSCLKKQKDRALNFRVRFMLPGENEEDRNLRAEALGNQLWSALSG